MKKKLVSISIFAMGFVSAQVGINTDEPSATLEIVPKESKGVGPNSASIEGIILPAISKKKALEMAKTGKVKESTLVYINDDADSLIAQAERSDSRINQISGKNLYMFFGGVWKRSSQIGDTPIDLNMYDQDGTLKGNRTVTQNANTLTFTGTANNAFSVKNPTSTTPILSVDATNSRLGIGTSSPRAKLDVEGNIRIGTATATAGGDEFSTVVRDNKTGELRTIVSSTGNTLPINYLTYTFSNLVGDFVQNYDTRIPESQYKVVVVGSKFTDINGQPIGLNPGQTGGTFTSVNVNSFLQNGTWRIQADYYGGAPVSGKNGIWTVYCLVINNSLVKNLNAITVNMNGRTDGQGQFPTGL